jgi:hypothetical protein
MLLSKLALSLTYEPTYLKRLNPWSRIERRICVPANPKSVYGTGVLVVELSRTIRRLAGQLDHQSIVHKREVRLLVRTLAFEDIFAREPRSPEPFLPPMPAV